MSAPSVETMTVAGTPISQRDAFIRPRPKPKHAHARQVSYSDMYVQQNSSASSIASFTEIPSPVTAQFSPRTKLKPRQFVNVALKCFSTPKRGALTLLACVSVFALVLQWRRWTVDFAGDVWAMDQIDTSEPLFLAQEIYESAGEDPVLEDYLEKRDPDTPKPSPNDDSPSESAENVNGPNELDNPNEFNDPNGFLDVSENDIAAEAYDPSSLPYRDNGLVYFSSEGETAHPIELLMRRADQDWQEKIDRQSRTRTEAAAEYKARYGRAPPVGFADWWVFATARGVQLKDEFDSIDAQMRHFRILSAEKLRELSASLIENEQLSANTFHLELRRGAPPRVHGTCSDSPQAAAMLRLFGHFSARLPFSLNVTFYAGTGAHTLAPRDRADYLGQLGSEPMSPEQRLRTEELIFADDYAPERIFSGQWRELCPAMSPVRLADEPTIFDGLTSSHDLANHSFVYDVGRAADLCSHPREAEAIAKREKTAIPKYKGLLPLFAFQGSEMTSDFVLPLPDESLAPPPSEDHSMAAEVERAEEEESESAPDLLPTHTTSDELPTAWRSKKNKMLWAVPLPRARWMFESLSAFLSTKAMSLFSVLTTGHSDTDGHYHDGIDEGIDLVWEDHGRTRHDSFMSTEFSRSDYIDAAFTGSVPKMCSQVKGHEVCEFVTTKLPLAETPAEDEYRYILSTEAGSGTLITGNTVTLRSTLYKDWFVDRIAPWVHYVPLKMDLSDLNDVMAYFMGVPKGKKRRGAHESAGEAIADAASQWASVYARAEDMEAYAYRFVLEYANMLYADKVQDMEDEQE